MRRRLRLDIGLHLAKPRTRHENLFFFLVAQARTVVVIFGPLMRVLGTPTRGVSRINGGRSGGRTQLSG